MNRFKGRLLVMLAVAACLALVAVTTTWISGELAGKAVRSRPRALSSPGVVTVSPDFPIRIPGGSPGGFAPPRVLAADPTRAGVWFWVTNGSLADKVYFYDLSTRVMSSWSFGPGINPLGGEGLAVAPDGIVWMAGETAVGHPDMLVRLDPSTGAIESFQIPTPADAPVAEGYRPPGMRGYHQVKDLAVNAEGQVAIALGAAGSVVIFNSTTKSFSQLALPGGYSVANVAYLSNGTLGVGMADWRSGVGIMESVLVKSPSASPVIVSAPSFSIAADGSQFVSDGSLSYVSPSGQVSQVPGSTDLLSDIHIGPGGRIVGIGNGNGDPIIVTPSQGTQVRIALGSYPCPGISPVSSPAPTPGAKLPPTTTTTNNGPPMCQRSMVSSVVDPAGNIWYVANDPQYAIGLVQAGTY